MDFIHFPAPTFKKKKNRVRQLYKCLAAVVLLAALCPLSAFKFWFVSTTYCIDFICAQ